jgi:CelD/BcsL family acetyltransferase involved in cellulose biosynthesis
MEDFSARPVRVADGFSGKASGGAAPTARRSSDPQTRPARLSTAAERRRPAISARDLRQDSQQIAVERADSTRLAAIRPMWLDLLRRSDEPNVFMDPVLVRAAAATYPDIECATFLAWSHADEARPRLVGIWTFCVGFARQSIIPVRVLTAPPFLHGYAATPVIDRSRLDDALDAVLDAIAADDCLPSIVALEAMAVDGTTMTALTRVLSRRGNPPCILDHSRRPRLRSDLDGPDYLQKALSAASRKKLRQQRRRLAEKGELTSVVITDPPAVRDALEHFLRIEASGWKGRQGTALLSNDADAAFTRAAIGALADEGCACIHALYLDQAPVSMQIVLRAGAGAFTWKIAYDEALRDFSPGMLLLEDYTAAFLEDTSIAFVDSCAYDESSFMSVWTEREAIANLWINPRHGRSLMFEVLSRLQGRYVALRKVAKRHLGPRRKRSPK